MISLASSSGLSLLGIFSPVSRRWVAVNGGGGKHSIATTNVYDFPCQKLGFIRILELENCLINTCNIFWGTYSNKVNLHVSVRINLRIFFFFL